MLDSFRLYSHPNSEDEQKNQRSPIYFGFSPHTKDSLIAEYSRKSSGETKNLNIFNYIEYHLENPGNLDFDHSLHKAKKKMIIRSNSVTLDTESHTEFMKVVFSKTKRDFSNYLKYIILEIASSEVFRLFKDYYPKVFFFFKQIFTIKKEFFIEKISIILTKMGDFQGFNFAKLQMIFKKLKKLKKNIKEDLEIFVSDNEIQKKHLKFLESKIQKFVI